MSSHSKLFGQNQRAKDKRDKAKALIQQQENDSTTEWSGEEKALVIWYKDELQRGRDTREKANSLYQQTLDDRTIVLSGDDQKCMETYCKKYKRDKAKALVQQQENDPTIEWSEEEKALVKWYKGDLQRGRERYAATKDAREAAKANREQNMERYRLHEEHLRRMKWQQMQQYHQIMQQQQQKSFIQQWDDLKAYQNKHGHVNVKASEDKSLFDFCSRMRHARNNQDSTALTNMQIVSLDTLGFVWSHGPKSLHQWDEAASFNGRFKYKNLDG